MTNGIKTNGAPGFSESGPPDDWDFGIGSVRGYRWWSWQVPASLAGCLKVDDDTARPLLGANNMHWGPGRQEATCGAYGAVAFQTDQSPHEPPEYHYPCGCGFWGYWDVNVPFKDHFSVTTFYAPAEQYSVFPRYYLSGKGLYSARIPVLGSVKATGRLIIGEKGFRSQYAEIESLCIPPEAASLLGWWTTITNVKDVKGYLTVTDMLRGKDTYSGNQSVQASADEVQFRLATLESMLSKLYPDAYVASSKDAMTSMFPPDKSYAS